MTTTPPQHIVFLQALHPWAVAAEVVSGRSGETYQVLIVGIEQSEETTSGYRHSCNCPSWRHTGGTKDIAGRRCCDHVIEAFLEWGRALSEYRQKAL